LDPRFEVVVVDSLSTDGTLDYLRKLETNGHIHLIVQKCTRGEGRQLAAANALGQVLVQQVDADQLYLPFFQRAAERYEAEVQKDPDVLLMFVPEERHNVLDRLPAGISFVNKQSFISRTRWRPLNYGEDREVFDLFVQEGHYLEAVPSYYAVQLKGGLLRALLGALWNQKAMLDAGFSLRTVVKATRHHGFLFVARAVMVSMAWILHELD
jgi:glycosyltransferase involved in cell wall biosynthesis